MKYILAHMAENGNDMVCKKYDTKHDALYAGIVEIAAGLRANLYIIQDQPAFPFEQAISCEKVRKQLGITDEPCGISDADIWSLVANYERKK